MVAYDLHDSHKKERDDLPSCFCRCLNSPDYDHRDDDKGQVGDDVHNADNIVEGSLIDTSSRGCKPWLRETALKGEGENSRGGPKSDHNQKAATQHQDTPLRTQNNNKTSDGSFREC
jgi:hypothetical protein